MNNNGVGRAPSSRGMIIFRLGEEISSGVGMRTMAQGYNVPDSNRQKYAMLERDSTGLDHTWWRKYESSAARGTALIRHPATLEIPRKLQRVPIHAEA